MDFHALPRRDLQALCKRNGVRANMTNAAMADALGALPTVDGVEEYVKQPAAVPEPVGKAAVEVDGGSLRKKQGSPLPRGRRVTFKTSEPVKQDEGKVEEKADAKGESNKEDDAPALGVGRRGASRRAQPAPVVAAPAAKEADEKQRSPPRRAGRATAKISEVVKPNDGNGEEQVKGEVKHDSSREEGAPALGVGRRGASRRARPAPAIGVPANQHVANANVEKQGSPPPPRRLATVKSTETDKAGGGMEKEALKREANKEDDPVQGAARRGLSRRARGSSVAAASAVERQTKMAMAAEEKPAEPVRPDGSVEKEDAMNPEDSKDGVPAQVVGRRGHSRRTRPAPLIFKPTSNAAVEEGLRSPPPRGRRATVSVKSSAPTSIEGGEENVKEEKQREAVKETMPALAVGRRGARGLARPEPAVPEPMCDVAAEEDALIPHGSRDKAKALRPIRTNGSDEEDKGELKLEEKEEDEPAQGVVRRGSSRRARPAPVQAAATRRSDAASTVEERDAPMEVVRAARVRKPTMKAAAAAEEKVPRRTRKKAAASDSTLQVEQQEEPQETVPGADSDKGCSDQVNVEQDVAPQIVEQSEVIDEPKQEDEEISEALMNEDGILTEETPADEPTVTDKVLIEESPEEEQPVIDQECTSDLAVEELRYNDKLPVEEQQVHFKLCATLPSLEDSPVLGLASMFAEQTPENEQDVGALSKDSAGTTEGRLDKEKDEDNNQAGEEIGMSIGEMEIVPFIQPLQAPLLNDELALEAGFTGLADNGKEIESSNSVLHRIETTTVDAEDGLVCHDRGDVTDDEIEAQPKTVDETIILDEMEAVETMASEQVQNEVAISDEENQVTLVDSIAGEKAELITEELPHSSAKLDEVVMEGNFQIDFAHDNELKEVLGMEKTEMVTEDLIPSITTMYECVVKDGFETDFDGENAEVVADKQPQIRAKMGEDVEEDDFQSDFVDLDEQKLALDVEKAQLVTDNLPQRTTTADDDAEKDFQADFVHVDERKEIATAKMQHSTGTMSEEAVGDDQLESDFVLAEKQNEVATAEQASKLTVTDSVGDEEEKHVGINQEAPQSTGTMDEQENVFAADKVLEITETEDEDVQMESAFTSDFSPEDIFRDSSDHITSALLDDITGSLSMITITEPTVSRSEDVLMCRNSSENITAETVLKNISDKSSDELVCRNKTEKTTDELTQENISENTAEQVAQENPKGVKVAKKSEDLKLLSLGKLKVMYKKTLEQRKEAKRVALSRVDENACRSNSTGQEQVQKLQQY